MLVRLDESEPRRATRLSHCSVYSQLTFHSLVALLARESQGLCSRTEN